jgi:broad specificity phosphatase PhoE
VLSSPFARAAATAERAVASSGLDLTIRFDERLRERDFGAFDGMTREGIREEYPDEARRRDLLGKFYYRPPGGESWADVALRVRSLLATEALRHDGERLLCVSHQAVIMVFRYVLEELAESQLLEIDRSEQVANASVTRYLRQDDGPWLLADFNAVGHLTADDRDSGAPVTEENDVPSPA